MSHVWRYSRNLGAGATLGFIGSGPLAILAGFALAAEVSIAQRAGQGVLHDLAVALLALGVGALVLTLLFVVAAQMYWATPSERLGWRPEATESLTALQDERRLQLQDYHLLVRYYNRVSSAFSVGLIATLLGLGCYLLAETTRWGHVIGAALLALAVPFVLMAYTERPAKVFPGPDQEAHRTPETLDDISVRSVIRGVEGSTPSPPPATIAQLKYEAERRDVAALLTDCLAVVRERCDGVYTTDSAIVGTRVVDGSFRPVIWLHIRTSAKVKGIAATFVLHDLAASNGITPDELRERLPLGTCEAALGHSCWLRHPSQLAVVLA